MRYERLVNPVSIPDGPAGELTGYLDHYPFSKGVTHWISRHNNYSGLEAMQIIENRRGKAAFSVTEALFATDFHQRRAHQKELFFRLPMRPLVKFAILYLGKRGFLDGRAGLTYAVLQSIYEYFIVIKTRELEQSMALPAPDPASVCPESVPAPVRPSLPIPGLTPDGDSEFGNMPVASARQTVAAASRRNP
ncbi:hypothetical protein [Cupriavidus basilensis]|uniref:hypothetical protein n=1 Tax=Cupriavidus basilensis TaxID=68895 RepID=UPI001ED97203|nr:hypothetical protein [Cupriavidus basilensis]